MQLWIVEHFFLRKKVPVVLLYNYSELHFSELTSYKIHTLKQMRQIKILDTVSLEYFSIKEFFNCYDYYWWLH